MACSCGDGRDDVAGGLLDSGGDVRVGLGGQPEVVGGVAERRMAHIGLQDWQQRPDVLAVRNPKAQIVAGKSVAEVMNTGPAAWPAVRDTGLPQEPAEVLLD